MRLLGKMRMKNKKMKVLVLANRDFVLYNFRLELLERLLKDNNEVYICLPNGPKVNSMIEIGCKFIPISIDKRGTNPFKDAQLIKEYKRIFKEVKPDMILTYTTKVCIYAGIVAGKMNIPYLMNVSGLGTAVEQPGILQPLMISLYRKAAKKAKCVFFQNEQNRDFFIQHKMYNGYYRMIPGSGVNLDRWRYMDYPGDDDGIHFLFIARIIKEKGIEEYLNCAKVIKEKYPNTVFHVLGPCDGKYKNILNKYQTTDIIKYHGEVSDTSEYLKYAHCTIHPSYYPEGISNVLLESEASGRPVITTDRAGCKETVEDGVTGFCFETKNTQKLIESVENFINMSNEGRKQMGKNARLKMKKEFDRNIVVEAYMDEIRG